MEEKVKVVEKRKKQTRKKKEETKKEKNLVDVFGVVNSDFSADDIRSKVKLFDYAFEGGKFSSDHKAYANCQGVVGWINPDPNAPEGMRVFVVLPEQVKLSYSNIWISTGADDLCDGRANTNKLLKCKNKNVEFPAAEYANNYTKNGVKKGEAFLPALVQLVCLCQNTEGLRESLKKIGGTFEWWLISSTEFRSSFVQIANSDDGFVTISMKDFNGCLVSCIIAY